MTALTLDSDTSRRLAELAHATGKTPVEIVREAVRAYQVQQYQPMADWQAVMGRLKDSPNFNGDPVKVQRALRDDWE